MIPSVILWVSSGCIDSKWIWTFLTEVTKAKLASLCKTHFQEKGTTVDVCQREITTVISWP